MRFARQLLGRHKGVEAGANGIAMPTSRNFDRQAWEASFQALTDGSPEDRSVFEAGLFVEDQLEIARASLARLSGVSKRQNAPQRMAALIGLLNMKCLGAMWRIRDLATSPDDIVPLERMLFERVIPGPDGGPGYTAEEMMEMLTDCMRHPLRAAIHEKGYGVVAESEQALPDEQVLELSAQLATVYDSFEKLWAGARWLGAGFSQKRQAAVFDETRGPLAAEELLNRCRRTYTLNKTSVESQEEQQALAAAVVRPYGVLVLGGDDASSISVEPLGRAPDIAQRAAISALITRDMTTDVERDALFAMRHSKLNCSVADMLNVWVQLQVLAMQCQNLAAGRLPKEYGGTPPHDPAATASFAPAELADLIGKATGLDPETVSVALRRFTFGLEALWSADLWDRPLVLADDRLLLAWHPLVTCHFGRLIAALVKDCSKATDAYAKRGHHFENHVVEALRTAAQLSTNASLRDAVILAARLDPQDERVGDVDCILVLGDTAFCMECRSVKQAATPYEQWDVADDLKQKKADQARRKRDYLQKNPGLLADIAARKGTPLRQAVTRFVAVVVSNCYLFEGQQQSEPYFVHLDTLVNMLTGGPLFQSLDPQGRKVGHLVDYFKEGATAGDAVLAELLSPAKAEYYRSMAVPNEFGIPALYPNGTQVYVAQLSLKPVTVDSLLEVLGQCSFASRLRVIPPDQWELMDTLGRRVEAATQAP